jgi:hypothetical protein
VLGRLSLHDDRPRGYSGRFFEDDDAWRADDLLRHLEFQGGRLYFDADYVRGRCLKTTVEVSSEGVNLPPRAEHVVKLMLERKTTRFANDLRFPRRRVPRGTYHNRQTRTRGRFPACSSYPPVRIMPMEVSFLSPDNT